MSDLSPMSGPLMCAATSNAIFSPGSADGASPLDTLDGQMTDLFGQEVAHVSRSVVRHEAGTFGGKTGAISGPFGALSSLNARLALSLASRLPMRAIGSMKSAMTWKVWVTPSGRRFCRLAVSVQTMRGLGFSLFATPTATANQACKSMQKHPGCRGIEETPEMWRERMGYPAEWDDCAPTVTPSSRKSRPSS
jgi:hypothetical protein